MPPPAKSIEGLSRADDHDRARIFLVMLPQFDKTALHEVCSSDHIRFRCIRFACTGSVTTSFSSESRSAIQQRDDHHRKRFDPAHGEANLGHSAEVSILSACKHAGIRLRSRSFLTPRPGDSKSFLKKSHGQVVTVEGAWRSPTSLRSVYHFFIAVWRAKKAQFIA